MTLKSIKKFLFTFTEKNYSSSERVTDLAAGYFKSEYENLVKDCDRVFAVLMGFQWVCGVILALILSPVTYSGTVSSIHSHVWLALFGGGALAVGPIYLYFRQPGDEVNRYVNVIAQGLFSALLIHITGGRIETHFHVFGSLAFFAFYRDIRVLLVGTLVVSLDHLVRGLFFAESVYGVADPTNLRWLEHAGWVIFEDMFLAYACMRSIHEMKIVALKRAEVEDQKEKVEIQVQDRTKDLVIEKNSIRNVLNSIEQGLFTVGADGFTGFQCSRACDKIFSKSIMNIHITDIFENDKDTWNELLPLVFEDQIPEESLTGLMPDMLYKDGKRIKFEYKIIRENHIVTSILLIATDMTLIHDLEERNRNEITKNAALIKVLSNKNDFIEAVELTHSLSDFRGDKATAKRTVHTLKGSFAFLECRWLSDVCHTAEDRIESANGSYQSVHETYQLLKTELEKFIHENAKILKINSEQQTVQVGLASLVKALKHVSSFNPDPKIYEAFDEMMMVPLAEELSWLNDAFVKTAESLNKNVSGVVFSRKDMIPTKVYRDLFRSFVHIARNAADHGIENSEIRRFSGKNEPGMLKISLAEYEETYEISFTDNGAGADLSRMRKLVERVGIPVPDNEAGLLDIIFSAGITTKEKITETSGRGVGLDAVRSEARKLGGDAWAVNHAGEGLTVVVQFKKIKFSQMSVDNNRRISA